MKLYKLSGNYITDIELLKSVPNLIKGKKLVIVTAADKQIEKEILQAAKLAEAGNKDFEEGFSKVRKAVLEVNANFSSGLAEVTAETLSDIRDILHGIYLVKYLSATTEAVLHQLNSLVNAQILQAYLASLGENYTLADPTKIFVSDSKTKDAKIKLEETKANFKGIKAGTIIPGGIAADKDGRPTIPGKFSYDYTAVIAATALGAEEIVIWTDKEGIYTADPDLVPNAYLIENLCPQEAMELSYFGAKIIQPFAFGQAFTNEIPIFITHSQLEEGKGTYISSKNKASGKMVTGIASIKDCAIVNISGSELTGKKGFAARVFTELAENDVNILMISQGSSETSICIVCTKEEAIKAQKALTSNLGDSIKAKTIEEISLEENVEVISVVGQGMKDRPGTAGKIFSLLGEEEINILTIAQGSSQYSISFAINQNQTVKALKKMHQHFLE